MNVLLTSAGRRVSLAKAFKEAFARIGGGKLLAADSSELASALYVCDEHILVPLCTSDTYIPALLGICERNHIDLIVPLIDTELSVQSAHRKDFLEVGAFPIVSDPTVIKICQDKINTHNFFERNSIPTVDFYEPDEDLSSLPFPLFIKPRSGSSSIDTYRVNDEDELRFYLERIEKPIIESLIEGDEYTIDALLDLDGSRVINAIPRKRIETRGGESSKGVTFKDDKLIGLAEKLLLKLKPRGPVTLQCFKVNDDYLFTEINPRFGGGYPLAHRAGANYPELILRMLAGESIDPVLGKFLEGLMMLRYDDAVFLNATGNVLTNEGQ